MFGAKGDRMELITVLDDKKSLRKHLNNKQCISDSLYWYEDNWRTSALKSYFIWESGESGDMYMWGNKS